MLKQKKYQLQVDKENFRCRVVTGVSVSKWYSMKDYFSECDRYSYSMWMTKIGTEEVVVGLEFILNNNPNLN